MEKLFLTIWRETKDSSGKMIDYRDVALNLKDWTRSELSSIQRWFKQLETQHWVFGAETITLGRINKQPTEEKIYTEILVKHESNYFKFSYNNRGFYVWTIQGISPNALINRILMISNS